MENWTLSWSKLIPLDLTNINNLDDNIEGVYRLSKQEGDKVFVFYVGKGKIKDRLKKHIDISEENEKIKAIVNNGKCFFRYSIITREEVRQSAEKKMYKVYQPSCNLVEPTGRDDINVNLD